MSVNFADMPWLVTVTSGEQSDTYGPSTMTGAVELRDSLRVAIGTGRTVEAWAAQAPNLNVVKSPEQAWIEAAA